MAPPRRIILTGASGFVGRHVLDLLGPETCVFALARRSPVLSGASTGANTRWFQVDISHPTEVAQVFDAIAIHGGADLLIHLAGHYDFTGGRDPAYRATNVDGMRYVLENACRIGVAGAIFASSVAACDFPPAGAAITEGSPADGRTPYSESKCAGECMLTGEFKTRLHSAIVRFAALYSDWGEYEPLYRFLETWLSHWPAAHVLAGQGASAIPYLHIRDAMAFTSALLTRLRDLQSGEVVLASPDGAVSHRALYDAATAAHFGQRAHPILVPKALCRPGVLLRDLAGQTLGVRPFERSWMVQMIDRQLTVDASRTRERLGWAPRPRFGVLRRLPFLIQNRKTFPGEWQQRNHVALRTSRLHENLQVHRLLERRATEVCERFTDDVLEMPGSRARTCPRQIVSAHHRVLLEALMNAIRTGEKGLFMNACRDLAERESEKGTPLEELSGRLAALGHRCVATLSDPGRGQRWQLALYDHIVMTVQFGIDEVEDVYEGAAGVQ